MEILRPKRETRRSRGTRAKPILLLAALLGICAWCPTAAAQDDDGADALIELSLDELLNVEITSVSKMAEKKSAAAAAIFVLTNEDIRRSGVTTIPDALRLVPGVEVAQIDSSKWSVTARGSAGRFSTKLLVLIDGRSVYTPFFSGVYWEAKDVMLEDVERIEVIRGPGGTLWGANAVNGVINIITKRAEDTQGGLLSVGGGSEEQGFGAFRYGGRAGDLGYYRVYGKFFNRDAGGAFVESQFTLGTGGDANDDWRMGQGGFRVDLDLSDRDTLTIQGDAYRNRSSATHDLIFFSGAPVRRIESTTDYAGWNVLGRWNRTLSERSDLQLQFYYDYYRTDDITVDEQRNTVDLDFQHRIQLAERHEFIYGADLRVTLDDFEATPTEILTPDRETDYLFSVFIQDRITITDDLKLTLGTKLEHNSFSGFEYQPSARLAWTPNERHTLWAAVSRAVRTPTRAEQDLRLNFFTSAATPGAFIVVFGSNDFDSEKLLSYELGYRVSVTKRLALDIATFYNDYNDLRFSELGALFVESDPPPDHVVIPVVIGNEASAKNWGFEITVDYQAKPWWFVQASFSFLETHVKNPQLGSNVEGDTPEQQFVLRNQFNLPHNVEFDTTLRFVGDLPALGIDNYVTLDARLAWHPRDNLELALVGRNLIESEHPEFASTIIFSLPTEVQRSVYGKVTWRF